MSNGTAENGNNMNEDDKPILNGDHNSGDEGDGDDQTSDSNPSLDSKYGLPSKVVKTYKAGDWVGEKGLLVKEPSDITVVAKSAIYVLKLSQEHYKMVTDDGFL